MSSEAARHISIPELLHALNEKLYLECNRLREYRPPPAVSIPSLETEIKSLEARAQDVLRLIPSLRNLLQPVNRLPPETLSRIAQCFLRGDAVVDARPIVPLTHVCRYWRESIISDPANWTLISHFSKDLMASTLERAKAAPLQVTLVPGNDLSSYPVPAPYIQNIGTLRFTKFTTIEELRQAVPGFPQSTPNLRSLSLGLVLGAVWDPSDDPFESLATALRCLGLFHIPLYPSILCLKSLTVFDYIHIGLDLHLDSLLDFLEENHLLESVTLGIVFREDSLRRSRGRAPIKNQLRDLSIHCLGKTMDGQALISGIGIRKGACLNVTCLACAKLNEILSGVSPTHLLNLRFPTRVEYQSYMRTIRLIGPNGELTMRTLHILDGGDPFVEFPLFSLTHIREFRLAHRVPEDEGYTSDFIVFDPSSFPALEILTIDCQTSVSHLLSALFSNPSSPPSLKTLAFLNCDLDGDFMEKLTRYASDRKGTTSAWLHQVIIVNSDGILPSVSSIRKLEEHVPVVDVKVGTKLPKDLS